MTPEQAAVFYEEDEDPVAVFAWFDDRPEPRDSLARRAYGETMSTPAPGPEGRPRQE